MSDEIKHTPDESGNLTLNTVLTLPLVKLCAWSAALLTAGWIANDKANNITQGIVKVQRDVTDLKTELRTELDRRTFDRWTRTDQQLWSYEFQRLNDGKMRIPEMTAGRPTSNP